MSLNLDKSAWKRVTFGDVVKNVNETVKDPESAGIDRVVAMEHLDPGELGISRWGSAQEGTTFTRRVRPGQTLFGKRRAYQHKAAYSEFDAICSGDILTFQAKDGVLLPEFLPFIVQSEPFYQRAILTSAGSLSPRTNWSDLAKYEFDLPPLDVQQRLADLLWAIERHQVTMSTLNARAVDTLTCNVSVWWNQYPLTPVGRIGKCVTGATPPKSNNQYWDSADVPFYTPTEIGGRYASGASQFVSNLGAEKGTVLPAGSVAVVCIGGRLGKASVIRTPGVTNQQITAITGLGDSDATLVRTLLAHPRGRRSLEERETTTIVRKLNKSDLMRVQIPFPMEREFMKATVKKIADTSEAIRTETIGLRALRGALLHEVFGG